MVTTADDFQLRSMVEKKESWGYHTDIYQHYQFRYPTCFTLAQWGEYVCLSFDPNTPSYTAPLHWQDCRFLFFKRRPFYFGIDLEEYLLFEERRGLVPRSKTRSILTDLRSGYRGIRAVSNRPDGKILSITLVYYQTWVIPIHAIIDDDNDLDIILARSVRFF